MSRHTCTIVHVGLRKINNETTFRNLKYLQNSIPFPSNVTKFTTLKIILFVANIAPENTKPRLSIVELQFFKIDYSPIETKLCPQVTKILKLNAKLYCRERKIYFFSKSISHFTLLTKGFRRCYVQTQGLNKSSS